MGLGTTGNDSGKGSFGLEGKGGSNFITVFGHQDQIISQGDYILN